MLKREPAMKLTENLKDTSYTLLKHMLKDMQRVAVAYSGGVDSTLLLHAASEALGDAVIAITALSATTPRQEYRDAVAFAQNAGIRHIAVETHELSIPEFIQNPPDRCYICKKHRYVALITEAYQQGYAIIADGENLDDANDYRPGSRAARELGVYSPLRDAGFTKKHIRRVSEMLGLHTWNKPALACLASRIPFHSPITSEKLMQIDAAETFLRGLGLSGQIRVRHFGDTARIEVDVADIVQMTGADIRNRTVRFFKEHGFTHVLLDMEGYQMGKLNPLSSRNKDEYVKKPDDCSATICG